MSTDTDTVFTTLLATADNITGISLRKTIAFFSLNAHRTHEPEYNQYRQFLRTSLNRGDAVSFQEVRRKVPEGLLLFKADILMSAETALKVVGRILRGVERSSGYFEIFRKAIPKLAPMITIKEKPSEGGKVAFKEETPMAGEFTSAESEKPTEIKADSRLSLEWEVIQNIIRNGHLSREQSAVLLDEFLLKVRESHRNVSQPPFALDQKHKDSETEPLEMVSMLQDPTYPEGMPSGYYLTTKVTPQSVAMGGPFHFTWDVTLGSQFIARASSTEQGERLAWNHHDQTYDPPGFWYQEVSFTSASAGAPNHRSRRIEFSVHGGKKRLAPNLQTARMHAWHDHRNLTKQNDSHLTTSPQAEAKTAVPAMSPRARDLAMSASELARHLGHQTSPFLVGRAVREISERLGEDIRKNDKYTIPYYKSAGDRTSTRNVVRYRLTPEGRKLVENYLREQGKIP